VLVESGDIAVTDAGRRRATCGPGEGVGEIALLRRIPRTASVVALVPVTAL
jgi:CRP-like cAMP-binding protein